MSELKSYIESLQKYQAALESEDRKTLVSLLEEGRKRKEEVDG